MNLAFHVANAPGGLGLALADADESVCQRSQQAFGQTVERAEAGLHLKGEAMRRVEDAHAGADSGHAADEAGLRAVQMDDVGLEFADEAAEADCGRDVAQRGGAASHGDFREADAK